MSKVLVIPDTHLKSAMFDLADIIMRDNEVDYAVQLGDNVDDFYAWEDDYRRHNARMVVFQHDHPNTVWLWGNHEMSYLLDRPVTGNAYCGKTYAKLYQETFNPKYLHVAGKVIFSHAGLFQDFLQLCKLDTIEDLPTLLNELDKLDDEKWWNDLSPLWARHKYEPGYTHKAPVLKDYIQVIGHTPMENIDQDEKAISTDVFSTNWGKKIGQEQMIIIDTGTGEWNVVDLDYRKVCDVK